MVQEQLLERLRALNLKHKQQLQQTATERDYVFVEEGTDEKFYVGDSSVSHDLSIDSAEQWSRELLEDPKNRLALAAFSNNPANTIITSRAAQIADTQTFNVAIAHEGSPVTNQRSSGRCWLFASTNVFRVALMKKHSLEQFELSQAYLFFWDKLEKANYFLESVLDTLDEPMDSRLMHQLLSSPVSDGGQWDMVVNLVGKYGLVPQTLYPDSYHAMNSSSMDTLITTKLREDAIRLRALANQSKLPKGALATAKKDMLQQVHLILTIMLGPSPLPNKEFTWEYKDKTGAYRRLTKTPLQFSQELSTPASIRSVGGIDVHKQFSLVNDPRHDYETLLSIDRLGNIWNGRPVTYVNVKMSDIKKAAMTMIKRGHPVFFGCDVGKFCDAQKGIMDTALYDYELGFNVHLGMNKAERLQALESSMTHAMVLTAVQVEDNKTVRWRVENSWSEDRGDKGYFVMTDSWMDQFVYQVVVDPSVVSDNILAVLKTKPKVLPLWDPMGTLA